MKKTTKGDTAQFEAEVVCEEKKVVEIEAEMRHPEAGGPELKLEDEPTVKRRMEIPIETNRKHYTTSNPADLRQG